MSVRKRQEVECKEGGEDDVEMFKYEWMQGVREVGGGGRKWLDHDERAI